MRAVKSDRTPGLKQKHLEAIREAARGTDNMLPFLKDALRDRCSIGEVCGAMRRLRCVPARRPMTVAISAQTHDAINRPVDTNPNAGQPAIGHRRWVSGRNLVRRRRPNGAVWALTIDEFIR